ncbi:ABC transporter ATP-binding protein [bacterium]|nr:ABC transporter ATP-binding protein [bacterium]
MIKASNLTRHYGDFVAADKISFEIPKGQIVGLLGHNGAGKTTTIKMLTGFLEPTYGTVDIDGLDIDNFRLDIQKKIGYLPENSPTYPDMTVVEYLYMVCELRGMSPHLRQKAIEEAISKTALGLKAHEKISTLSKGLKQRVGVAQAIVHKPQILILDEPTSGLDPTQIFEMRKLIKDLSKDSTILLSTHILQEVEAICDRVIMIFRGKLVKDALLWELTGASQLLVTINQKPEVAKAVLAKASGIIDVSFVKEEGAHYTYRLKTRDNMMDAASDVASLVYDKEWKLFELKREVKNLETVFSEMMALSGGAA